MPNVHFTEDVYVVYKKPDLNKWPQTCLVEEIERGLTYSDAIGLELKLNREDDSIPRNIEGVKEHLYSYMTEEQFDEYQKPFKVNPQISLF